MRRYRWVTRRQEAEGVLSGRPAVGEVREKAAQAVQHHAAQDV